MIKIYSNILFLILIFISFGCKSKTEYNESKNKVKIDGMVWIPGGIYQQGASINDKMALPHEKPSHNVKVDGFYMDVTEVTNNQFSKFVDATNYVTTAERPIDWALIASQLPEGTPKPNDSILQPGSLLFKKTKTTVPNLYDFSQWWKWSIGANWKQPNGIGSTIIGKENHPVVHISFQDAKEYCKWAGRRLPTEAEWEYATQAGNLVENSNSVLAELRDQAWFEMTSQNLGSAAVVGQRQPNAWGLYDLQGNVMEWTTDWYAPYDQAKLQDPKGPEAPPNPAYPKKVARGGAWQGLFGRATEAGLRSSRRYNLAAWTQAFNLGFRCAADAL